MILKDCFVIGVCVARVVVVLKGEKEERRTENQKPKNPKKKQEPVKRGERERS